MKFHHVSKVPVLMYLTLTILLFCRAGNVLAMAPPEVLWDRTYGDGLVYSVAETFDRGVIATGFSCV